MASGTPGATTYSTLETSVRYQESKEQSAEVLRRVLAFMGQHDAALNPVSYTLWYEYATGINSALTHSVDRAIKQSPRLNDAIVLALYQAHVADGDSKTMNRITVELQRMLGEMVESATRTGNQAGLFGNQLEELNSALSANDAAALQQLVSQTLVGSNAMQSTAQALEQQVKSSHQEIERLQSELVRARDEVVMDPLTRVLNRKGFDQRLKEMMESPNDPNATHCLVMLDIDHFKKVNDMYGHVMGDRVIQALGEVLRSCVDKKNAVARYGGEEFAVVMPNCTLDESTRLAVLVRLKTRAMKIRDRRTQEVELTVSVSAGVAAIQPGDDAQTLIARADSALYKSKQGGRNRVTCAA
jgi:diguanylate cyclase